LVQRAQQAKDFPQSGRRVPEYGRDDLRELLERPDRIVYRVLPEQVDVVTVWHFRRVLPGVLI
jgi:plasmid stabilization system protein ParE